MAYKRNSRTLYTIQKSLSEQETRDKHTNKICLSHKKKYKKKPDIYKTYNHTNKKTIHFSKYKQETTEETYIVNPKYKNLPWHLLNEVGMDDFWVQVNPKIQ